MISYKLKPTTVISKRRDYIKLALNNPINHAFSLNVCNSVCRVSTFSTLISRTRTGPRLPNSTCHFEVVEANTGDLLWTFIVDVYAARVTTYSKIWWYLQLKLSPFTLTSIYVYLWDFEVTSLSSHHLSRRHVWLRQLLYIMQVNGSDLKLHKLF